MQAIPVSLLSESIITLLTEVYPGPPDPTRTWFIDNAPDSGILGVLRDVTAAEAVIFRPILHQSFAPKLHQQHGGAAPPGLRPCCTTLAAKIRHRVPPALL